VVTGPGTAPTVRPSLIARSAVTVEPDGWAASTTIVISASAAMIRFRTGNDHLAGTSPGGRSEITAPLAAIRSYARAARGG
jgi:hypothetical protein